MTLPVAGSIRATSFVAPSATHSDPAPAAIPFGMSPRGTWAVMCPFDASIAPAASASIPGSPRWRRWTATGTTTTAATTATATTIATRPRRLRGDLRGRDPVAARPSLRGIDGLGPGLPVDRRGRKDVPLVLDTLEPMHAAVGEGEPGAARELGGRARDQDVAATPQRHDPRAHHDGDPAELLPDVLALAEVDARPDLDPQLAHRLGRLACARDRRGGLLEAREEAVPGGVVLRAAEPFDRAPNHPVVLVDEGLPPSIAQLLGDRRAVDHVREQHRGQRPAARALHGRYTGPCTGRCKAKADRRHDWSAATIG